MKFSFLEDEYWYGGSVHVGYKMPIGQDTNIDINLIHGKEICDQSAPLFLSSKGRYLHSDKPFMVQFRKGIAKVEGISAVELTEGHGSLKGAQMAAARKYFTISGEIPEPIFLKVPQYNTWIELMYNQNQRQILEYARSLVEAGLEPGVLMIDEGWAPDYGDYDFCRRKFDNPKAMVKELHAMGFRVMLWVTPHISPDSDCFRVLRSTDYLIRDKNGELAIRKWWNGYSCVLDLSNPKACSWFTGKLKNLMERYDVDGFKFDAGGAYMYRSDDDTYIRQEAREHTKSFDICGANFRYNELRCVWDCSGMPIVCRLQDKVPAWHNVDEVNLGLCSLIPNMLIQGLLGYYYGCPDMIGGGGYGSFLESDYQTDEELYLRWLQASVLCPMMQFSISPKRILSKKGMQSVKKITELHKEYAEVILKLAQNAANSGEPIMRMMEYEFPGQEFEKVMDQFMLGEKILVAPVVVQYAKSRSVKLPEGRWMVANSGEIYLGGKEIEVEATVDQLPIFFKLEAET